MPKIKLVLSTNHFDPKHRVRWETKLYEGKPAWVQTYSTNNGKPWKQGIVVFIEE